MARSSISAALVGWLSLTVALSAAPTAPAAEGEATVAAQCAALAKRVTEVADGKPVQIGQFAPVGLSANFGPGLEESLKTALEAANARVVTKDAAFEVHGTYAFAKTRGSEFDGRKVVKVDAEVVDLEFAETITRIPLRIDANEEVAEVIGVTGTIAEPAPKPDPAAPAPGAEAEKNKQRADLEQLEASPTASVRNGSQVQPDSESLLAVEVMAGPSLSQLRPRAATVQDGKVFVDLELGEVFQLRVYNGSEEEIGVKASLDGLNSFHFADKVHRGPDGKLTVGPHYIYEPGQTLDIPGWFLRMEGQNNYQAFSMVEYGAGAASSQGRDASGRIGVIHVQFSDVAPPGKAGDLVKGGGTKSLEIDRGEGFTVDQKSVRREVLPPFAFVTIRYDRAR
ncbi:hypothetical protein [Alienimonas californiensis]|uniref:Uncharacterized protein n=1 Tax=Alienimonas californiensis TaxID=2527989 RepID=A0A517P6I9_9PLAN|nr:hypothetical protein [Alienimonas californiensis]QDT14996.1 hypothetical protein CA12_10760 [Alienimonas californiensis]